MGYLLLRDNKQTGPYSTEEIIAKGFKPYDLIWLEGKSAGWRYPGELPEFAAHAPMVEEQPFDRFYKKTSQSTSASSNNSGSSNNSSGITSTINAVAKSESVPEKQTTIIRATITEQVPDANSVPDAEPAKVISIQSRKIFVTMPGNSVVPTTNSKQAPAVPKQVIKEEEARYMPQPVAEKPSPKEVIAEKSIASYPSYNAGYSSNTSLVNDRLQSSKEDDNIYVAPKRRNTARVFLTSAVAACLLLGGVIIGLLISNNKQSPEQEQINARLQQIKDRNAGKIDPASIVAPPTQAPAAEQTVLTDNTIDQPKNNELPSTPDNEANNESNNIAKNAVSKEPIVNSNQTSTDKRSSNEASKTVSAPVTNSNEKDVTDNRKPAPVVNESARKNIYELVSVSGSNYKVGVLGGISNLELTVSNNSLYPIDQLQVSINYMNVEKKVVRTETILVNDVAAGEQKTVPVAKSKRGVSVSYTITRINSRALGLAHSGL